MTRLTFAPHLRSAQPSLIRAIFDAAPPGALNMGLGMPDIDIPAPARQAVSDALTRPRAPYTPNAGRADVRDAIARMYAAWRDAGACVGSWLGADDTIVTVGAQEALYVAIASLCAPGDALLVPDPGFPAYAMIARALGVEAIPYPLDPARGFRPSPADVLARITPRTRAAILNTPSNPLGVTMTAEEVEGLALALAMRGVPWISDEVYDRYVYGDAHFASPSRFSDLGMVVGGLSKSAGLMGWRIGWLITPPGQRRVPLAVHQAVCSCASSLSQDAAVAALNDLAEHPDRLAPTLERFDARRRAACAALDAAGLTYAPADGAFYLFVHVAPHLPDGEDDLAFCKRLLHEQKLIVIPGQGFGDRGRGWVRVAYTTDDVEEGIGRLIAGLQSAA